MKNNAQRREDENSSPAAGRKRAEKEAAAAAIIKRNQQFETAPTAPAYEYACVDLVEIHGENRFANFCDMPENNRQIRSAPPPYRFHRIPQHVYDMIDPKSGCEWMFGVALVSLVCAALSTGCAVSCAVCAHTYCPFYTGVWVSALFLINGAAGIAAAKKATTNFFVAHLVTAILAFVGAVILIALSVRNFSHAGFEGEYCVSPRWNIDLWKAIWDMQQYDFGRCVFELKLGVAFNVLMATCAAVKVILTVASSILCCRHLCDCEKWRLSPRIS